MKAVCKKLFSLMLVAILLVSAVPFQASAEETVAPATEAPTEAPTETPVVETEAPVVLAAAEGEEEIDENIPVVYAEVISDEAVYLEYEIHVNGGQYRVVDHYVRTQTGEKISTATESQVLEAWRRVTGSSEGYELSRWEIKGVPFNGTISVELVNGATDTYKNPEDGKTYPLLHVVAVVEKVARNIELRPNGGTIANTELKVLVDEPYSYFGALPIPTRSGYTFEGWYKDNGTRVDNATVVTDLGRLTAQWKTGRYTVTFEAYNGGWKAVDGFVFRVDNDSVLDSDYNNFPTEAEKSLFKLTGWTIDGWEYSNDGKETWKTFTEGKTEITNDTTIRPLYKKNITLYACDAGNTTRQLTVTLGKKFPTLPHPGTREGYAFVGWGYKVGEMTAENCVSLKADLGNVAKHPVVTVDIEALYAAWDHATTVYLYIHTNGNTKEHTKLVKYYDVPVNGFYLTEIDLADIFPNYGKYDDKGDEKYGWFNPAQWENYCLGRHKYETTEYVDAKYLDPEKDDINEFYIMLIDNGNNNNTSNGNGYNDNKNTVDSSNPSTGDDIFVTVAIMAVSACAVLLIFMNKKRFVK